MPGIELTWPNKGRVLYRVPQRGEMHKPVYYGDPGTPPWPDHRPLLRRSSHGDHDADPNRLIQGDNLVGLQALLDEGMAGRFQCIYIDPPFNTGTAFEHYEDGYEHTIWLGLMRDRIKMLYKLLAETGSVFVHLDDNEIDYLRLLMDEIFGRRNFVNRITLEARSPSAFSTVNPGVFKASEYMLWYAKNKDQFEEKSVRVPKPRPDTAYNKWLENPDAPFQEWRFSTLREAFLQKGGVCDKCKRIDEQRLANFVVHNARHVFRFTAISDTGAGKATVEAKQRSEAEPGLVFRVERDRGLEPQYIYNGQQITFYSKNVIEINGRLTATTLLTNVWTDISWEGIAGEGGVKFKKGKKPEALLKRVLELSTTEGDWVLDSFAGSGTTAAVASQMNRRWVTIEQGDHARTHCLPRLEKARLGEAPYKFAAQGGFVFEEVGPPLVIPDETLGIDRINPIYENGVYQRAVCRLTGFTPRDGDPLLHGRAGSDGGRFCHVAARGLLVTDEYLAPLRRTLAGLAHENGQDTPTCIVYATKTATVGGDGVEVARVPGAFKKNKKNGSH